MPPLARIESRAILLATDDIDTDQIIPARFLKTTDRLGLGRHLFADWRYEADGTAKPDFVLNAPGASARRLLIGGRNFGCGSSREHAPWALADFGVQAVVAPSFADIFRNNALKNGIVPVQLTREQHETLVRHVSNAPDDAACVDVTAQQFRIGSHAWSFPLAPFARHCLLEGIDQLGHLLGAAPEIAQYEQAHPAPFATFA